LISYYSLNSYAPWCPSCQQTDSEWETFAKNGETLQISVGKIDVIQEPGTVNVEHKMQKYNDFFILNFSDIQKN
jgi:thiol-disulfide isomerase/thioredoxin